MQNIPELPPDGERLITEFSGQIVHEHLHRYAVAKQYVADKDVLDIACGEGYGSNFLCQGAKTVVGVDVSELAVSHAQIKYSAKNLSFLVGSCIAIPLPDASVDLVVSFETLEHFTEHEIFLREVKRILRPDGLLIISSPDKRNYSDKPNHRNQFHLRELYHEEFKELIQKSFKKSSFGKQIYYPGSFIELETPTPIAHISGDYQSASYTSLMEEAIYSLAFASDIKLPDIGSSLFQAQIDNTASSLITVQLFAKSDQQFCEEKSIRILSTKESRSVLEFNNLERFLESGVLYLRLDPADTVCRVDLHSVVLIIKKPNGEIESQPLVTPATFANLIEIDAEAKSYLSTSNDPQLFFNPIEVESGSSISLSLEINISSDYQFVREKLSHLRSEINNKKSTIVTLHQQLTESQSSLETSKQELEVHKASLEICQQKLAERQSKLEKRQLELEQKDRVIGENQNQLFEINNLLKEAQIQLSSRELTINELHQSNILFQDKIKRMQNSFSWKLTGPLRALRRVIIK